MNNYYYSSVEPFGGKWFRERKQMNYREPSSEDGSENSGDTSNIGDCIELLMEHRHDVTAFDHSEHDTENMIIYDKAEGESKIKAVLEVESKFTKYYSGNSTHEVMTPKFVKWNQKLFQG